MEAANDLKRKGGEIEVPALKIWVYLIEKRLQDVELAVIFIGESIFKLIRLKRHWIRYILIDE